MLSNLPLRTHFRRPVTRYAIKISNIFEKHQRTLIMKTSCDRSKTAPAVKLKITLGSVVFEKLCLFGLKKMVCSRLLLVKCNSHDFEICKLKY